MRLPRMPTMPMKSKTDGQPYEYTNQPIMGANRGVAKHSAELEMADAATRSLDGNPAATTPPVGGNEAAAARPRSTTTATRVTTAAAPVPRSPIEPWSRVKIDQMNALHK